MNGNTQKHNWWIDAALFGAFLLTFFLDLTGLALHQWLGVAAGALALYQLARHWTWMRAVRCSQQWFSQRRRRTGRLCG